MGDYRWERARPGPAPPAAPQPARARPVCRGERAHPAPLLLVLRGFAATTPENPFKAPHNDVWAKMRERERLAPAFHVEGGQNEKQPNKQLAGLLCCLSACFSAPFCDSVLLLTGFLATSLLRPPSLPVQTLPRLLPRRRHRSSAYFPH